MGTADLPAEAQEGDEDLIPESITVEEMLEDLVARYAKPTELEPGETTRKLFAEATGRSQKGAWDVLENLVQAGKMTSRWALDPDTGRKCKAYRPVVESVNTAENN